MAIGDIRGKVSSRDIDKIRDKRNPPEYEPGFEPDDLDLEFSDLFDSLEDLDIGGPVGGSPFGSSSGSPFGERLIGSSFSGGSPFGITYATGQDKKIEPSTFDKAIDKSGEALEASGKLLMELVKSVRSKNAEDIGYYARNLILTSLVMIIVGVALGIIGVFSGIPVLLIYKLPMHVIVAGALTLGTGIITIASSAVYILNNKGDNREVESSNNDIDFEIDEEDLFELSDDADDEYAKDLDKLIDELLEDMPEARDNKSEDYIKKTSDGIPGEKLIENIQREAMLNREILFRNLRGMFPTNTPDYNYRKEIESDSDEFIYIETIALKALAAAAKKELEDIESRLESLYETMFCYELRLTRVKGLNKLDDVEREMTAYFREDSDDMSVSSEVLLEGDFYKIIINKGLTKIITVGDIIRSKEAEEFFLDEGNALPLIVGIDLKGKPVLADAKYFDTVLIAGKQRSGKSWHVLSFIITLMSFNTPEDIQFLIIDPKKSNLFKTMSLMPHVCGVHDDSNILGILKDIIESEGERRKKLLVDNGCDDIWELRESKGIKLPVFYIVIDEIMTVMANLGINEDDFSELCKVIISQFPSLGIRLLIVPHRAQSVVDKTIRSLISYAAVICGDKEVVLETLDIKKWNIPLINKGDAAIRIQGERKEMFVKSVAVSTSNPKNREIIRDLAIAFYKMGVYVPDMSSIGIGYNRDEHYIKEELKRQTDGYMVQYDLDLDNDDNLDLI